MEKHRVGERKWKRKGRLGAKVSFRALPFFIISFAHHAFSFFSVPLFSNTFDSGVRSGSNGVDLTVNTASPKLVILSWGNGHKNKDFNLTNLLELKRSMEHLKGNNHSWSIILFWKVRWKQANWHGFPMCFKCDQWDWPEISLTIIFTLLWHGQSLTWPPIPR